MYFLEKNLEILKNAKKAMKFENVFAEHYDWSNFINHLNDSIKMDNPNAVTTDVKKTVGFVNFWQRLTITIDHSTDSHFPRLSEKIDFIKNYYKNHFFDAFSIISFTDSEPTTGRHTDDVDVFNWQCIGSTTWVITYEDNTTESFTLNPGDIIYVPAGVLHEVTSLNPRACLSFMFEAK